MHLVHFSILGIFVLSLSCRRTVHLRFLFLPRGASIPMPSWWRPVLVFLYFNLCLLSLFPFHSFRHVTSTKKSITHMISSQWINYDDWMIVSLAGGWGYLMLLLKIASLPVLWWTCGSLPFSCPAESHAEGRLWQFVDSFTFQSLLLLFPSA